MSLQFFIVPSTSTSFRIAASIVKPSPPYPLPLIQHDMVHLIAMTSEIVMGLQAYYHSLSAGRGGWRNCHHLQPICQHEGVSPLCDSQYFQDSVRT